MSKVFFSSLARISDLPAAEVAFAPRPRDTWRDGDYVAGEVVRRRGAMTTVELTTGRQVEVAEGDVVVGALGARCATLEAVGDWRALPEGGPRLEALTAACVFGRCTSRSSFLPPLLAMRYRGHVCVGGAARNMLDYARPAGEVPCRAPLILIVGTSMDAGKTLTARVLIRLLKARGLRVAGVKFTGVGRYRDVLSMGDAGADVIYDFADAGLPSTCCPRPAFEGAMDRLLSYLGEAEVDAVVAEAGASPLEPYNGEVVVERVRELVRGTILCASDPYAVPGVMQAFALRPDLIAGRATSTTAAIDLLKKLSPVKALNVLDRKARAEMDGWLAGRLGL